MSVILVLVAFSVTVAIGFLIAFFWSVRNGQYDDTYSSSVRILFEDDKPPQTNAGESAPANTLNDQPQNQ
jgi:cbb3-type cytochrome oxidase maturation protein